MGAQSEDRKGSNFAIWQHCYKVLCNGGVELNSDDSGYADANTANGGNGVQDVHHEARMRMHRRHESGSRRSVSCIKS